MLTVDAAGKPIWTWRTLEDSTYDRVVYLANDGLKPGEIAAELEVNKSTVSRHLRRAKEAGLVTGVRNGR